VALNDRWAKGHVRLASAYIALGGHSNDACNSLQRALQLDPGYPSARDMLIRELRREHANRAESSTNCRPEPSAPPQQFDDQDYTNNQSSSGIPQREEPLRQARQRAPHNPYHDQPPPLDDRLSLQDRISFYYNRTKMWYLAQSDDVRTVLKVLVGLLCLYVAFGGRFGLEHYLGGDRRRPQRGNYRTGNAYDQYYEGQRRTTTSETRRGEYTYQTNNKHRDYSRTSAYSSRGNNDQYRDGYSTYYNNDHDHYASRRSRGGWNNGGVSFQMPNLFDGSLQSMLMLAGIAYMCYRNGVNPMQVLFFLNMMNGGRRRNRGMFRYGGGMGGMGGMMGGMGGMGGFGRRRW